MAGALARGEDLGEPFAMCGILRKELRVGDSEAGGKLTEASRRPKDR